MGLAPDDFFETSRKNEMKTKSVATTLSVLGMILAPLSGALADELPPANAKPLSAVLVAVQEHDVGRVVEVEFDHGRWEVKACSSTACQKLFINPLTGSEEGRRSTGFEHTPASGSTPIATIIQRVEAARVGVVTGVDFDHGHWKVELAIPSVNTH